MKGYQFQKQTVALRPDSMCPKCGALRKDGQRLCKCVKTGLCEACKGSKLSCNRTCRRSGRCGHCACKPALPLFYR